MEGMSEHTGLISSLSLLLVQTQAARWKAATPEQLTGAHLYLDIAKSGYLFHWYSGGMVWYQSVHGAVHLWSCCVLPHKEEVDIVMHLCTWLAVKPTQFTVSINFLQNCWPCQIVILRSCFLCMTTSWHGNTFQFTVPLCRESTSNKRTALMLPLLAWTSCLEQTIQMPMIWGAMSLIQSR